MINAEKIRYGVIGLKGYGRTHIASVLKNSQVELTAIIHKGFKYTKKISKMILPYRLFSLPKKYANSANYLYDTELEDCSSIMAQSSILRKSDIDDSQ